MSEIFSRNIMYWGSDFQEFLTSLNIAVFGLGGVGGYALEALCRAGVGNFTLIDFDVVSKSNINRQIIATNSAVGLKKTQVFEKRLKEINTEVNLVIFDDFYDSDKNNEIFSQNFSFVVDAIDTLRAKISLIKYCYDNKINIVTSFGAGNRVDAQRLMVSDISQITSKCAFTKNVLSRLKKEGIEANLPVVWSEERPKSLLKVKNIEKITKSDGTEIELTKFTPASTPVVPAVSGLLCANYILNYFLSDFKK